MNNFDWRNKSDYDLWKKRHFYMSCFVRRKRPIKQDVYECIDLLISQGHQPPLDSLDLVDKEVIEYYDNYVQNRSQILTNNNDYSS